MIAEREAWTCPGCGEPVDPTAPFRTADDGLHHAHSECSAGFGPEPLEGFDGLPRLSL